jgi:hypothetical protein
MERLWSWSYDADSSDYLPIATTKNNYNTCAETRPLCAPYSSPCV